MDCNPTSQQVEYFGISFHAVDTMSRYNKLLLSCLPLQGGYIIGIICLSVCLQNYSKRLRSDIEQIKKKCRKKHKDGMSRFWW